MCFVLYVEGGLKLNGSNFYGNLIKLVRYFDEVNGVFISIIWLCILFGKSIVGEE